GGRVRPASGPRGGGRTPTAGPPRPLHLLAPGRTSRTLAVRPASARAADRVPDGHRLGRPATRAPGATSRGPARLARLRSGRTVDARDLHRPRPLGPARGPPGAEAGRTA